MDKFFFNSMRTETDPSVDLIVKQLIESNQLENVNKILLSLNSNNYNSNTFPAPLKEYLKNTSHLPSWINQKKIKKAQDLFKLYGLEISLILLFKSLPQSYCCPKGVKVLSATGRLSKDPTYKKFARRITETSQFVMNVLSDKGFEAEGAAIITTQKVRMIHASIRYYLRKYGWDAETDGEPINQQDMVGTLMSFSALIIEGLEELNIKWSEEEKDAFIHCWNVVGYVLGVKEEYLPKNYNEAIAVGYEIFNDQKGYSPEGVELTNALISYMHYIIPGNLFDGIAESMVCFFLGPENIQYIGVKPQDDFLKTRLPFIYKMVGEIADDLKDHSTIVKTIAKPISKIILKGILYSYNDFKGPALLIPPSLQENWQLKTGWENTFSIGDLLGRRLAIQKKINTLD